MSRSIVARLSCVMLLAGTPLTAQQPAATSADLVAATALRYERGAARRLAQAAQDMPEGKYSFTPTPAQWTFAEIVAHITDENDQSCDPILGRAQHAKEPAASDGKAALIAALKASFARCDTAFTGVTQARLAQQVTFYGSQSTIVNILFSAVGDWQDHYAQEAIYLRLNGILPPTAR